jgi:hypothetical protein
MQIAEPSVTKLHGKIQKQQNFGYVLLTDCRLLVEHAKDITCQEKLQTFLERK